MGQIIEEIITDFTKGIADDVRRTEVGLSQIVTNFDIFTNRKRAFPYPDTESGDSGSVASQKASFDIGKWTPAGDWRLFSLGVVSGTGKAEILMKTLGTGGTGDLGDAGWLTPANNQSSAGATAFRLFVYYKTTGKFYGAKSASTIWSFTPDGSTGFNDSEHSLASVGDAQGIVHSKDDCLYIPAGNIIARNNAGVWTDAALTLPSHLTITSIDEYQTYIVIAATPISGVGKSVHYLWDRDASLTTLSESYDGGEGSTQVIAQLNGTVISIALAGASGVRTRNRIVFRKLSNNGFQKFSEIIAPYNATIVLRNIRQKVDDRVYFMMAISIDGVTREGIWSVGIASDGTFAIAHESTPANDTPITANSGVIVGFFICGDYKFISYVDTSGNYQLSKTNDQASYTATSIYETVIKNGGDSDLIKQLIGGALMFEPLPSGGKVALYYKKNADTGWTRLFFCNTQNEISHGAVNIEDDTNPFTVTIASPAVFTLANHGLIAGQEIRFSTTGALPTGLTAGTHYFVLASSLTSSTFKISATSGGAAINTSGTQSGTHTLSRLNAKIEEGKEYKLRAESTGGAVITGLKYKMEILDKQLF